MPNLSSLFRSEVSRLARKELKAELAPLRKTIASQRDEIARLKRAARLLVQGMRELKRLAGKRAIVAKSDASSRRLRFSAKGFKTHRLRLGLSAANCGLLVGASGQSVYNWETEKSKPQGRQLEAIAAFRKLGKREAATRLAAAN